MRAIAISAGLLLLSAPICAFDWSTHGPIGGAVTQIAISPAAPRVVYAAGGAGVFRSDDAGETWRNVSGSLDFVTLLAVDPTNADVVFAAAGLSIVKSTDGGASWRAVTDQPFTRDPSALLIDPGNPSTIYVGSRCGPIGFSKGSPIGTASPNPFDGAGVFKSVDGGITWTSQFQGLSGRSFSLCVEELSLDPAAPRHLFTTPEHSDGGDSESYDAATTWTRAATHVPGRVVIDDPTLTSTRYGVTMSGGLGRFLRSADGGVTWTTFAPSGPPFVFNDLAQDPATGRLFLATDQGVFRSGDGGGTWAATAAPTIPTAHVLVDRPAGFVFAANALGLFRAPLPLGPWQQIALGDPSTDVRHVVADPHDPSVVYALVFDYQSTSGPFGLHGRIFGSRDNGGTWQLLRENDQLGHASIVADGTGDLYEHSGDGLWRYSPATGEWIQRASPPGFMLAADRRRAGYLYAFNNDLSGAFGVSTDGGDSWRSVTAPLGRNTVKTVAIDPTRPSTVYAGGSTGIARSTDGGLTWATLKTSDTALLAIAPSDPSRLYRIATTVPFSLAVDVFRSDDGGGSWIRLHFPDEVAGATSLAVDPRDGQSLWVASGAGHVLHTSDGGVTWEDAGIPARASELAIAADGSHLHAATSAFGVWDALVAPAVRRRGVTH